MWERIDSWEISATWSWNRTKYDEREKELKNIKENIITMMKHYNIKFFSYELYKFKSNTISNL